MKVILLSLFAAVAFAAFGIDISDGTFFHTSNLQTLAAVCLKVIGPVWRKTTFLLPLFKLGVEATASVKILVRDCALILSKLRTTSLGCWIGSCRYLHIHVPKLRWKQCS